jgi:hypothetical protein
MKKILWISDYDTNDHIGGAELTTDAFIEILKKSPDHEIYHVKTHSLNRSILDEGYDLVIMDSLTNLRSMLIYDIMNKYPFISLEYDYNKVSYNRHLMDDKNEYLNMDSDWAMLWKTFWAHPNRVMSFFMSKKQLDIHLEKINDAGVKIVDNKMLVISSNFSIDTYAFIDKLLIKRYSNENWVSEKYLVFDTKNPLKGTEKSIQYCKDNNLEYELFSNLSPKQLLSLMSKSKGLVYMPTMHDTCPRMVIEAKLLGLDVHINDFVQMKDEDWYSSPDDYNSIKKYLFNNRILFMMIINQTLNYFENNK